MFLRYGFGFYAGNFSVVYMYGSFKNLLVGYIYNLSAQGIIHQFHRWVGLNLFGGSTFKERKLLYICIKFRDFEKDYFDRYDVGIPGSRSGNGLCVQ